MIYQWRCKKCDYEQEVNRRVDDRDQGPEERCPHCECSEWYRIITGGTGFKLLGGGWFRDGY